MNGERPRPCGWQAVLSIKHLAPLPTAVAASRQPLDHRCPVQPLRLARYFLYIFEIETQRVDGGTGTHGIMTTKTQLSGASIGSLFSLSCRNLQHFFLNRTCLQPVCTMDMFEPVVEDLNAMF
jgi:hypothetical protein